MNKLTFYIVTVALLWCLGAARRPGVAGPAPAVPQRSGVSIITLNLAKETGVARMLAEFRANPALRDADVLLLQEVKDSAALDLAAGLGLHVASVEARNSSEQGLAIASRWPLTEVRNVPLPAYDLAFHNRMRFALAATVETPAGSVRVCNTHLDTRLNAQERLAQIAPVVEESAGAAGPALIGGDFNSNPFYWVGHVVPLPAWRHQSDSVWQYMTGRGFRSTLAPEAATFDHLGMHLDWIWARDMRVGPSEVYPLRFSDHHAVRTRVTF